MAFGKIIESTFFGENQRRWRIEIFKRDYEGHVYTPDLQVPAFELHRPKGTRHHFPIRGSGADIHLYAANDNELNAIADLALAQEDDTRVNIDFLAITWQPYWSGKLISEEFEEEYRNFPVAATLTATDGLSSLREKIFPDDDPQRLTQIEIIAKCLQQTGLQLNIHTADDWYPVGEQIGDEHDPLAQVKLNPYRAYAREREDQVKQAEGSHRRFGTSRGISRAGVGEERPRAGSRPSGEKYSDCYKILEDICINKFLEIKQVRGVWEIIQRTANNKSSYTVRRYNSAGVYQSNFTRKQHVSLGAREWRADPRPIRTKAIKSVAVTYHHGKQVEVFENLNWESWVSSAWNTYPEGWTFTQRTYPDNALPGFITRVPSNFLRGGPVAKMTGSGAPVGGFDISLLSSLKRTYVVPPREARIRFRMSHLGLFARMSLGIVGRSWGFVRVRIDDKHLNQQGGLESSPLFILLNLQEDWQSLEVLTENVIEISSEIEIEIVAPIFIGENVQSAAWAAHYTPPQIDFLTGEDEEEDVDESVAKDTNAVVVNSTDTDHFEYNEPILHGDGPSSFHLGYMTRSNNELTTLWRRSDVEDDLPLHRLLTMFLLRYGVRSRRIHRGTLSGDFNANQVVTVGGRPYMFDSGTFNPQTNEHTGEWYELRDDAAQILYDEFAVDEPGTFSFFGSSAETFFRFSNAFENILSTRAIAFTSAPLAAGVEHTQIPIGPIGETLLNQGDRIVLVNRATAQPYQLTITQTQEPQDDVLHTDPFTPDEEIIVNSSISLHDGDIKTFLIATDQAVQINTSILDNNGLTAQSNLTLRVVEAEDDISVNAGAIATLQTNVSALQNDVEANSSAILTLDSRVTVNEGDISTNASAILSAESSITTLQGDTRSVQRAGTAPTTRPSGEALQPGDIWLDSSDNDAAYVWNGTAWVDYDGKVKLDVDANASAILSLDSRVTVNEGDISTNVTAIANLEAHTAIGEGSATAALTLKSRIDTHGGEIDDIWSQVVLKAQVSEGGVTKLASISLSASIGDEPTSIKLLADVLDLNGVVKISTQVDADGRFIEIVEDRITMHGTFNNILISNFIDTDINANVLEISNASFRVLSNPLIGNDIGNRDYNDGRYSFKAGSSSQAFSVANASESAHAVSRGFGDGRYAAINHNHDSVYARHHVGTYSGAPPDALGKDGDSAHDVDLGGKYMKFGGSWLKLN